MTGSVKSGMARWRGGASHSAAIFQVADGTPASLKLYMPSGGGPSALAGLAVCRATSAMTAAAVRPREIVTFALPSGWCRRVLQRVCGHTTDSAVLRMRLG